MNPASSSAATVRTILRGERPLVGIGLIAAGVCSVQ